MHRDAAPPLPSLVMAEPFADGPPRWYVRRGRRILAGSSQIDVLTQLWDQDAAWLGIAESPRRLASAHDPAPRR
jgi:hypothetical protein